MDTNINCIWGSLQRPMGPPAAKRYLLYFGLKNAASAKSNFKYIFTEIHHQKTDTFIDTFIGETPKNCFFSCQGGRHKSSVGSIKNLHLYIFRNLNFVFSVLICRSSVFCILALGSGQRLLYRLGSGLGLVLVLRFCAYSYGGPAP